MAALAYVWGQTNHSWTTWTDTTAVDPNGNTVTARFYKVQRILGSPIAAGASFSAAVTPNGNLWTWGANDDGQLGDGVDETVEQYRPYPGEATAPTACVGQTISNPISVACGIDFLVAVDATGTVWTCGGNSDWQLGWGAQGYDGYPPSPVLGISNVIAVSAGEFHTFALCANGTVWAWGSDYYYNQLGDGGLVSSNDCSCTNSPVQSIFPSGTFIVAIAAGAYHSVALDTNGNVWAWGDGGSGQLGNGQDTNVGTPAQVAGISNVVAIAAGYSHTVAVTADKTVWDWGDDSFGELGTRAGNNSVPGQVYTNDFSCYLSNMVSIAAGYGFTLAATTGGQVYAWGNNGDTSTNDSGELGTNGITYYTPYPLVVPGISNAVLVAAPVAYDYEDGYLSGNNGSLAEGGAHALAMTLDPVDGSGQATNHYWGWGDNYVGEVGNDVSGGLTNQYEVNQYSPAGPLQFCTLCERCVQLGTGGVFTAQCNGTLYLYFNGDLTNFGASFLQNYGGSYTVSVSGPGLTNSAVTVWGTNYQGLAVGTVTVGDTCTFSASGYCAYNSAGYRADPNDVDPSTQQYVNCSPSPVNNNFGKTNSVCPMWQCFSLVGKIQ